MSETKISESLFRGAMIVLAFFGLAMAWRWTPLGGWVDFETIAGWEQSVKGSPAAPYIVVAVYLLGGLLFFPVTILTLATVFTFGPVAGNLYALMGWLSSAAFGYGMGRALGRDFLRELAGPRLDCLDREAGRKGLIAVLAVRVLPIAPFTLVNLFLGASPIRFRDFMLGSLLGRAPGLVALTLFGYHLENALRNPAVGKFVLPAVTLAGILLVYAWLRRLFQERDGVVGEP